MLKGYWDAGFLDSPWTPKVILFVSLGILFHLGWYSKGFLSKRNSKTKPAKSSSEKALPMEIAQVSILSLHGGLYD